MVLSAPVIDMICDDAFAGTGGCRRCLPHDEFVFLYFCIFGFLGHGWVRRFEQSLHGKKEEYHLKTASCFCIFHDPRGGLRACRCWYITCL